MPGTEPDPPTPTPSDTEDADPPGQLEVGRDTPVAIYRHEDSGSQLTVNDPDTIPEDVTVNGQTFEFVTVLQPESKTVDLRQNYPVIDDLVLRLFVDDTDEHGGVLSAPTDIDEDGQLRYTLPDGTTIGLDIAHEKYLPEHKGGTAPDDYIGNL